MQSVLAGVHDVVLHIIILVNSAELLSSSSICQRHNLLSFMVIVYFRLYLWCQDSFNIKLWDTVITLNQKPLVNKLLHLLMAVTVLLHLFL